jgi:hypothetical protein
VRVYRLCGREEKVLLRALTTLTPHIPPTTTPPISEEEFFKKVNALKGAKAVSLAEAPIKNVRELSTYPGIGGGTAEKLTVFLRTYVPGSGPGSSSSSSAGAGAGGGAASASLLKKGDPEFEYVEALDKSIVVDLIRDGSVTLAKVREWRGDITEADL